MVAGSQDVPREDNSDSTSTAIGTPYRFWCYFRHITRIPTRHPFKKRIQYLKYAEYNVVKDEDKQDLSRHIILISDIVAKVC